MDRGTTRPWAPITTPFAPDRAELTPNYDWWASIREVRREAKECRSPMQWFRRERRAGVWTRLTTHPGASSHIGADRDAGMQGTRVAD